MDELKKQLKEFRGCFIFLGVILLILIFFGTVHALDPIIGWYSVFPAVAAVAFAIFFWVSLTKGVGWAKIIAGIVCVIIGLGITAFIIFDFVTSMIKGSSLLKTEAITGGNYGQSAFIIFMLGMGIFGGGLFLLGWKKGEL